jgi:putative SOS response-associated peptidase YedK
VLIDGFYEWRPLGGRKMPVRIVRPDRAPLALAGVWEMSNGLTAGSRTCAVLTCAANPHLTALHDRMPVILDSAAQAAWLDPLTPAEGLLELLRPYDGRLEMYDVAPLVNDVRNDVPACIEPFAAAPTLFDVPA